MHLPVDKTRSLITAATHNIAKKVWLCAALFANQFIIFSVKERKGGRFTVRRASGYKDIVSFMIKMHRQIVK